MATVKPQKQAPPYLRAEWEIADASAIQALYRGDATSDQQQRALQWIINVAGANDDLPWLPESDRVSSFFAGRQFVARQVVKLLKINLNVLIKHKET